MRWILPPVTIFCLPLFVWAEFCDKNMKMTNLRKEIENQREITQNQTELFLELVEINKNQSSVIEEQELKILEQRAIIEGMNETKFIREQKATLAELRRVNQQQREQLQSVLFMVKFNGAHDFATNAVVKFDNALTNIGGGYVINNGSADDGKFVAPVDGDYYFLASVMNHNDNIGLDLMVNGAVHITSGNSQDGVAVAATVARLAAGDKVWLVKPHWSSGVFEQYTSFFTGHLFK